MTTAALTQSDKRSSRTPVDPGPGLVTVPDDARPRPPKSRRNRRRQLLWAALVMTGTAWLATNGRSMLANTVSTFGRLRWPWLVAAVSTEAGSMAAFASSSDGWSWPRWPRSLESGRSVTVTPSLLSLFEPPTHQGI
jgi:hypothetical protein